MHKKFIMHNNTCLFLINDDLSSTFSNIFTGQLPYQNAFLII